MGETPEIIDTEKILFLEKMFFAPKLAKYTGLTAKKIRKAMDAGEIESFENKSNIISVRKYINRKLQASPSLKTKSELVEALKCGD